MNRYLLIFSCLFIHLTVNAQLDTSFWFVAPEVAISHGDRPIVFRFASLNDPATITIVQPANPTFPVQTINLAANSAQTVDLTNWIDIIENKPANSILNFGFKITSTVPVTAYYEVTPSCNCNPDIFSLKGKNALGTAFMTPFQNFLNNASYARSAFNIVATENNTTVTIIPTQAIVGHPAGVPFAITLNKGQTYCAEALSTSSNFHLGGSVVSSDKPIAVTLSDDTAEGTPYGGCADLMGDQLIPENVTGEEYIAIKGYLNGPDKVYVLAITNGTQVSVDGILTTTLNAGQTYVYTLNNPTVYIQTSNPSYVLHQSGFGCEVGEAILPPIVCTGSNTVAFVRSTNEFFAINLLVPSGGENDFLFNGATGVINGASFLTVPGTGNGWKYAQINASSWLGAQQAGRISNPNYKFHMGLIHGGSSSGCRYGYFSDFASFSYQIDVNDQTFCVGDTVIMVTNNLPGATYEWSGPNGFSAVGDSIVLTNAQLVQSGQYIVSGNLPSACSLLSDSALIEVISIPQAPLITSNFPICAGEELEFFNNVQPPFVGIWTNAAGDTLSISSMFLFTNTSSGPYTVNAVSALNNCISPPSNFTINVPELPSVSYVGPTEVCGNTVDFNSSVTADQSDQISSYTWSGSNGVIGNTSALNNVTSPNTPFVIDSFAVMVETQNGCIATDSFSVQFNPIPISQWAWEQICGGLMVDFEHSYQWLGQPSPSDAISYVISYGDQTFGNDPDQTHEFPNSGTFESVLVTTSASSCADTVALSIAIEPVPQVTFVVNDGCGLTDFEAFIEPTSLVVDSLLWQFPAQFTGQGLSVSNQFPETGTYTGSFTVSTPNECIYSYPLSADVILSIPFEELQLANVITPNGDGINDSWTIGELFTNCNDFQMEILNRWGNVVYSFTQDEPFFSGKDISGNDLIEGVYFYRFTSNEKLLHGNITLIR